MFQLLSFLSPQEFWENFKEIGFLAPAIIAAGILLVFVILGIVKKARGGLKWDTRILTYGAVCVGLAYVLSFVKIFELPNGGSITAASMLPILAYGYMAGPLYGTAAGLVYFLLQLPFTHAVCVRLRSAFYRFRYSCRRNPHKKSKRKSLLRLYSGYCCPLSLPLYCGLCFLGRKCA